MLDWAQTETLNWAKAEYSIMIKLKGSPYYHDYVDQGTILDRVVGSSRVRNIENISVPLELTCFFGSKTLRLIPFFEQNFHFLDQMVLFLDLDCQNLASLDFDNCPISKKDHLISEMKISLSEMKLRLRVFPPQSKSIPEVQNIYSWILNYCSLLSSFFRVFALKDFKHTSWANIQWESCIHIVCLCHCPRSSENLEI